MRCARFLTVYILVITTGYTSKPAHHEVALRCENNITTTHLFQDINSSLKNETASYQIVHRRDNQVRTYNFVGRSFVGIKLLNFGILKSIKHFVKRVINMYNVYKSEMNFGMCLTKYFGPKMHSIFEKQNTHASRSYAVGTGRNGDVIQIGVGISSLIGDYLQVISGITQTLAAYALYLPGAVQIITSFPGLNERVAAYMHVFSGVAQRISGYLQIVCGVTQLIAGYFQVIPAVIELIFSYVRSGMDQFVSIFFLEIVPGVSTVIAGIMQVIPGITQLISGYQELAPNLQELISNRNGNGRAQRDLGLMEYEEHVLTTIADNLQVIPRAAQLFLDYQQIAPAVEQLISNKNETVRSQRDVNLMEYEENILTAIAGYLQVIPGVRQLFSSMNWMLQLYNHKVALCFKKFLEKKFWEWIET